MLDAIDGAEQVREYYKYKCNVFLRVPDSLVSGLLEVQCIRYSSSILKIKD